MKNLPTIFIVLLLLPLMALGEENDSDGNVQGYAFVAPGKVHQTSTLHFGGGAEFDLYKGLGFSTDIGYIGRAQHLGEGGFGILSPNARYAFKISENSKLVPYVTGGYSLFFVREDAANAFNFGGGIDYWFHEF